MSENGKKNDFSDYDFEGAESLLNQEHERHSPADEPAVVVDNTGPEENTKIQDVVVKTAKYADLQIYRGGNIIAVRINGRNYTSADENLPDDVKEIMRKVSDGEPLAAIYKEFGLNNSRLGSNMFDTLISATVSFVKNERNIYKVIIAVLAIILLIQIFR